MRLILKEQQKYLQSFINNATYHSMNPDANVTYQTVNLYYIYKLYFAIFLKKVHCQTPKISKSCYTS